MGMTAQYRRVPVETLEKLLAHPETMEEFLVPMVLSEGTGLPLPREVLSLLESMPPGQKEEMLARLQALMAGATDMANAVGDSRLAHKLSGAVGRDPLTPETPAEPPLDIDKSWHGLHFLLCGTAEEALPPLGNAVLGGRPVGEDLGYGPCRYLTAIEVQATAAALSALTEGQLRQRYDGPAMDAAHIYPGGWGAVENFEWLAEAFASVREYFRGAATAGDAMLLYLT